MVGNEVDSGQGQPRATGLHQGHRTEGCVGGFNDYWRVCMLQMILSTVSSYNMFVPRAPTICLYDCICHSGAGAGQGN